MAAKKTDSKGSTSKAAGKAVASAPTKDGKRVPLHEVLEKLHKTHGHLLKKPEK